LNRTKIAPDGSNRARLIYTNPDGAIEDLTEEGRQRV